MDSFAVEKPILANMEGLFYIFSLHVVNQAQKRIVSLLLEISEKDEVIRELSDSLKDLSIEIQDWQALNARLDLEMERIRSESERGKGLQEEVASQNEIRVQLEKEIRALQEERLYLVNEHERNKKELSSLRESFERVKLSFDSTHKQLEQLTKALISAETALDDEAQKRRVAEEENATLSSQLSDCRQRLATCEADNAHLRTVNSANNMRIAASIEQQSRVHGLTTELAATKASLAQMTEHVRVLEAQSRSIHQTPVTVAVRSTPSSEVLPSVQDQQQQQGRRVITPTQASSPSVPATLLSDVSDSTSSSRRPSLVGLHSPELVPTTSHSSDKLLLRPKIKDPDQEALATGILLSKQEAEYGVNMFDALRKEDELVIHEYTAQGFTYEEAVYLIFRDRFILPAKGDFAEDTMMSLVKTLFLPPSPSFLTHLSRSRM